MPKLTIKVKQPKIILPFNGEINHDTCYGIRLNYRLHTQCSNPKVVDGDYCVTCQKSVIDSTVPTYGDIRDRLKVEMLDYVDPKGKSTLPMYKVIKHFKYTMDDVLKEAKRLHYHIPDVHLEEHQPCNKRGRPKKETVIENGFEKEQKQLWAEYENKKSSSSSIEVRSFYHKGRIYLKTQAGGVFDIDTEKFLGVYNPETNCIEGNPILCIDDNES